MKFVAANICSSPALITELSRFIGRTPHELLTFTLSHTLPSLVATCSKDEVVTIAQMVGRPPAPLIMEKSTDILKCIFLLPDDGDTDEALHFITQIIEDAASAHAGSVGTQALVKSCIAGLLAELVMVLGDEDPKVAKSVSNLVLNENM